MGNRNTKPGADSDGQTNRARDRRKHRRAAVNATAVLLDEGVELGHYLVQNLSAGGALLTGDDGPELGSLLTVLLEIEGQTPFELAGHVIRRKERLGQLSAIAVAFEHESGYTEDLILSAMGLGGPDSLRPTDSDHDLLV